MNETLMNTMPQSPVTEGTRNIAIFDLDYTLTQRGTWGRFVVSCVSDKPLKWLPTLLAAGLGQLKYKCGKAERVTVKQAMIRRGMAGMSRKAIYEKASIFADAEIEDGLRPGGIAELKAHQEQGDIVIIASAAADVIVKAISERLEIKYWIATDTGWDDQDNLVPEFSSPNCYGPEKVRRIKELFKENPEIKKNNQIITMYSDSYSDLEILCFADVGIAVNPDKKLEAYALKNGMSVVDWT